MVCQCKAAGVPVFVKQLGASPVEYEEDGMTGMFPIALTDRKGTDPAEWPADLRVREFPR